MSVSNGAETASHASQPANSIVTSAKASCRLKGIMSGNWEWIQWIPSVRYKECRVAGAYFLFCFDAILILILKMHALAASHLTATL
jgi:hypothetical protein